MPTDKRKVIYANAVGVSFTGGEVFINLGVQVSPQSPQDELIDQGVVGMSPGTAKFLATILSKVIGAQEKASGQVIALDESKIKMVDDAIEAANRANAERRASPG